MLAVIATLHIYYDFIYIIVFNKFINESKIALSNHLTSEGLRERSFTGEPINEINIGLT